MAVPVHYIHILAAFRQLGVLALLANYKYSSEVPLNRNTTKNKVYFLSLYAKVCIYLLWGNLMKLGVAEEW